MLLQSLYSLQLKSMQLLLYLFLISFSQLVFSTPDNPLRVCRSKVTTLNRSWALSSATSIVCVAQSSKIGYSKVFLVGAARKYSICEFTVDTKRYSLVHLAMYKRKYLV